jgi:hypothetical protein
VYPLIQSKENIKRCTRGCGVPSDKQAKTITSQSGWVEPFFKECDVGYDIALILFFCYDQFPSSQYPRVTTYIYVYTNIYDKKRS